MLQTVKVNNIVFRVGRAYLYKVVNSGEQSEHTEKYALAPEDMATLRDIMRDNDLLAVQKWKKIALVVNNFVEA